MAVTYYSFVDTWRVLSTIEEVSEILQHGNDLSRWWPSIYLESRETRTGPKNGTGTYVEMHAQGGRFPYTLHWQAETIANNYPHGFTVRATGDFEGTGEWTFHQDGDWVDVTFEWNIEVKAPVLRLFSPVLKPLLADNHRWAMMRGEESLKLELARRHAVDDQARRLIPPPPGPRVDWSFTATILGGLALAAACLLWTCYATVRLITTPRTGS